MCPLGPLTSGPCSPRPCVTGFLPCAGSSRLTCAAAGVRTPFLSKAGSDRTACVDHTWSTIHPSMDARCFHVLPGVTVAAVKVVCGCLCETVFRFSWVNTSLDHVVLFVERPLSCPPWRLHHCIDMPASSVHGLQFHYLIDTCYFLFSFVLRSHPNGCEVILLCGFHLRFPHDQGCWASFCLLHLRVFFGEMPIPVLCPFESIFPCCWVLGVCCMFWMLTPIRYVFWVFFPIPEVTCSLSWLCPWMPRRF